ncbi:glycosyltransferase [Singulisphaera sp. PoT]|uniref:glycosyltransferase n=1 Tax=Singulisphaera sp. PoT TaxID=3411797 RepID=UPI003BF59B31
MWASRQVESVSGTSDEVGTYYFRDRRRISGLLAGGRGLRREVKRFGADLVHVHYGAAQALIAVLFSPCPVIVSFCGSDLMGHYDERGSKTRGGRLSALLSQLAAIGARRCIAKTEELRRTLWLRRCRAKCEVIPNGVALERFQPVSQESARAALGWEPDRPTVVFVDRKGAWVKDPALAHAAFRSLQRHIPEADLKVIMGADPGMMPLILSAADALLLTSRHEGSSNLLKEALACNLPVVSTACGDAPERLDGVSRCHIVPRDPEAFGERLAEILRDRQRSDGRLHVADLSEEIIAERVRSVYRRALARPALQAVSALVLAMMALFPGSVNEARAASYHIAVDGDDAGPGTVERPWASVEPVARRLRPGDVVHVKAGVYRRCWSVSNCSGSEDQPISFAAEGGPVTIDGSQVVKGWQSKGDGIYAVEVPGGTVHIVWNDSRQLHGPDYQQSFAALRPAKGKLRRGECVQEGRWLFARLHDDGDPNQHVMRIGYDSCILLHATQHTNWTGIGTEWGLDGFKLEGGSSHNVIEKAEIRHHHQGILEVGRTDAQAAPQFNTFRNLSIHHIGLTKFEHGIYTGGIRTSVRSCRFQAITGAAIHAFPEALQGNYEGNIITDPEPFTSPGDLKQGLTERPKHYYSAFVGWGLGGHRFCNNVVVGRFGPALDIHSDGNWITNNTILVDGGAAISLWGSGNRITNNIIRAGGYYMNAEQAMPLADYNAYLGGRGWRSGKKVHATLAEIRAEGHERHGFEADLGFRDAERGDWRPASNGAFQDRGTSLGAPSIDVLGRSRPEGSGIDLGAYEGGG